jgi:orotate phosphoribosyltransferase-like protein
MPMAAFTTRLLQVWAVNSLVDGDLSTNFSRKGSDWVCIIDTGLKSSEGKTIREVLLDVLEAFAKYDLESAEGTKKAIKDIEAKVGEVATIKEHTIHSLNRGYISKFIITSISHLLNKIP